MHCSSHSVKLFISPIRGRSFLEAESQKNGPTLSGNFTAINVLDPESALRYMLCCVKLTLHKSLSEQRRSGIESPVKPPVSKVMGSHSSFCSREQKHHMKQDL